MRVIAGSARSIRLIYPRKTDIRPTTDMVREALFNSLGPQVSGCRFADLYAGSGSVGIEALSRGAAHCVFLESNHHCLEALRRNLENTRLKERATVVYGDCRRRLAEVWAGGPVDIVFMDPPYDHDPTPLVQDFCAQAAKKGHTCMLIVQCGLQWEPPLEPVKTKQYGETRVYFFDIGTETHCADHDWHD